MPGAADQEDRALGVWMEELKTHAGDIRNRVDLQHRNFNVFIVLTTALTGYLVNYWNDHGLQDGADALLHSEIVLLVLLVPLFACVFAWRHADHDANIIDDAAYVETVVRPKLRSYAGDPSLLQWESFLRRRRIERMKRVGPVAMFSTEPVIMGLIGAIYLGAAWYLSGVQGSYGGEAQQLFDLLLYVDSALFALTAYVTATTAFGGYADLGAADGGGEEPVPVTEALGAPSEGHSGSPGEPQNE